MKVHAVKENDIYSVGVFILQLLMKSLDVGQKKPEWIYPRQFDENDIFNYIVDRDTFLHKYEKKLISNKWQTEGGYASTYGQQICDQVIKCVMKSKHARIDLDVVIKTLKKMYVIKEKYKNKKPQLNVLLRTDRFLTMRSRYQIPNTS